jgi:hypothetical protein
MCGPCEDCRRLGEPDKNGFCECSLRLEDLDKEDLIRVIVEHISLTDLGNKLCYFNGDKYCELPREGSI